MFMMEAAVNRKNDHILSGDLSAVPIDHKMIFKSQKPQLVIIFAAVTRDGHKSPIIFVEANTKINSDICIEILKNKIYPWVLSIYRKRLFVSSKTGHPARKTQEWLTVNFPGFWGKSIWPPYSPDLNVMDHSIWSILESKACAKPHQNVVQLKQSLKKAWASISPETIVSACSNFQCRLREVVKNKGSHVE